MSGSTIGGIVGGVIGFVASGYNPQGFQYGWMIGSAVGGYVDPTVIKGPQLTDPQQQTASEGAPIPLVYGTYAVIGTIIQCQSEPTEHKHKEGGKGGPVQETFTYTRTVAMLICRAAPLGGEMKLRRAWVNGKLAYDATGSGALDADSAKFLAGMTFYSGSETQMPDANLEALPVGDGGGVGNVPAYRGSCYAVLPNCDVTQSGGAVPIIKWEVVSSGVASTTCLESDMVAWWPLDDAVAGGTAREVVAGKDGTYSTGVTSGGPLVAGSGGCARFTDFGQYMVAGDGVTAPIAQVSSMNEWTVSCWSRPSLYSDGTNDGGSVLRAVAQYATDDFQYGSHNWRLQFRYPSSPPEQKNMTPNGSTSDNTTDLAVNLKDDNPASAGNVVFMVMTWKKNPSDTNPPNSAHGDYCLYVNGALVDSQDDLNNPGSTGRYIIAGGGYGPYPESYQFIGDVSDVKVYSRALSAADVAAKYRTVDEWIESPDGGGIYVNREGIVYAPCANVITSDTIDLESIVGDLIERGGVSDYDVTALDGIPVLGFAITQPTTAGACIDELRKVFFFDLPEWGNSSDTYPKLRAVLRGGNSVVTLTDDDLVDVDDDEDIRRQAAEFPRKVNFIAPDPDHDYEPITQSAERESENVTSTSEITISTAVASTRDMAAPIADKMLRVACEEAQGQVKRTVPEEFTQFTTSDIVTENGRRYRIDQIDAQDGQSTWTLTRDRASAYESNATGSVGVDVPDPVSSLRGPTIGLAMNLTSLRSSDNVPGMYLAACGLLAGWSGCDVYLSTDGGTTETKVATIIDPATMGWLTADLDSSDVLSVQLYNDDELDDATDDQLAVNINQCAVLSGGVAEILQFKDATDTGTKTYDLETLTRGELGTTEVNHSIDDDFVLLDGSVLFLPLDVSLSGKDLIYRFATRGTTPANNDTITVTFDPPTFVIDGGGA